MYLFIGYVVVNPVLENEHEWVYQRRDVNNFIHEINHIHSHDIANDQLNGLSKLYNAKLLSTYGWQIFFS